MSAAGMTSTLLATRLAEAVRADEAADGCDLSAGLFGPAVSALLREIADELTKDPHAAHLAAQMAHDANLAAQTRRAEAWSKLMDLCGSWQDGSLETVKLFQDDATKTCHVEVVGHGSTYANTFMEAVRLAAA